MTERVHNRALEHPPDRAWPRRRVLVFPHRVFLDRSGRHRPPVHRDGVVHEQLDSHSGETRRGRGARAMGRRLVGEEELGASMGEIRVPMMPDDIGACE